MKPAPLLLVPFREVRHDQPDDCLHYEPVEVRGSEMDWTIPAHRHEGLHQFQLLETGRMSGTIDGRPFEAEAPAMLLLAPGSVHGFSYSPNAVGHQVTLPTATLQHLLAGSNLAGGELAASFVLSGDSIAAGARECATLFHAVAREFNSQDVGRVHSLLAYATLLVLQYLRRRGEQVLHAKQPGSRDALVQRFRALVDKEFRSHRPLAFYAGALGVTPDHLSRSCRQITGESALDLLHGRLMLEARRLLAYTSMPVAGIALQLGYEDPAYFSKFFARCVGDTPSAYRELVAQGVRGTADPA
jgi:AraC family transcriptional activator of pobA